jgi:hypothetical protein
VTGESFFLWAHEPGWLVRLDVPLFVGHCTLRTRPRLPRARERWALVSGGLIGPPSGPQIAALSTRWVHRQERLVQPTNRAARGVAVRVGLHQLPARAVVRGLRVVPRVDRHHRIQNGLQRDRAGTRTAAARRSSASGRPRCELVSVRIQVRAGAIDRLPGWRAVRMALEEAGRAARPLGWRAADGSAGW